MSLPVSTISRAVQRIQADAKLVLLRRSTDGLHLTSAGRDYLEACRRNLAAFQEILDILDTHRGEPQGKLHVYSPDSPSARTKVRAFVGVVGQGIYGPGRQYLHIPSNAPHRFYKLRPARAFAVPVLARRSENFSLYSSTLLFRLVPRTPLPNCAFLSRLHKDGSCGYAIGKRHFAQEMSKKAL